MGRNRNTNVYLKEETSNKSSCFALTSNDLLDRRLPKKRIPKCEKCELNGIYNERFDSYFCPEDNLWLEPECGCDPTECEFAERPPFPREAV